MATDKQHQSLDPKYDDYDFPTISPSTQSGHPGHTTQQQDAQVHQLRMILEQAGYTQRLDTLTLVRWRSSNYYTYSFTIASFPASKEIRCPKVQGYVRRSDVFCFGGYTHFKSSGSLIVKSGGRNLEGELTHWCRPGTIRRRNRYSNIIHNTTTRQTRYGYVIDLGTITN